MNEPDVTAQARFGESGEIEVDEEIDTDLADWGVVEEEQERKTQYEQPEASEFGVDDRAVTKKSQSEQETLFADVADDQVTLGGEQASTQSKW